MSRSYALIWIVVFAFWLAIVWDHFGAGGAIAVFWTGVVAWGLGRTGMTMTPVPSSAPRSDAARTRRDPSPS